MLPSVSVGRVLLALVVAATALTGCRNEDKTSKTTTPSDDDDTATLQDGSETAAAETDSQLITSSLLSATPGTSLSLESTDLAGDLSPKTFGDAARAVYFPRGCLDVQLPDATGTAIYEFTRCIGPNGLRAVSGEVKAKATSTDGALRLDLTATGLSVNKATIDWAATAIVRVTADGARQMTWTAQLSGTTARGRSFSRTSEYTITWTPGEACFALDGKADGQVGSREIRTQIEGFQRCRRGCPDSGKIVVTNVPKNRTFELTYDGSNQATFTAPNGKQAQIPLLCAQ